MPCTSHFALWEAQHLSVFRASLEWLQYGSVNHTREGRFDSVPTDLDAQRPS
jgi:hypothetical protein